MSKGFSSPDFEKEYNALKAVMDGEYAFERANEECLRLRAVYTKAQQSGDSEKIALAKEKYLTAKAKMDSLRYNPQVD